MNWQFIRAIAEKDLAEVAKNRIAVTGAVVLSSGFCRRVPLLITQIAILSGEAIAFIEVSHHISHPSGSTWRGSLPNNSRSS